MKINSASASLMLRQMQALAAQSGGAAAPKAAAVQDGFAKALVHSIDRIDALKSQSVAAGQAYERGTPGVGLDQVMVSVARADVALNMGVQVRNHVVSAYREIMNMQV